MPEQTPTLRDLVSLAEEGQRNRESDAKDGVEGAAESVRMGEAVIEELLHTRMDAVVTGQAEGVRSDVAPISDTFCTMFVTVRRGRERARVYAAGGIGYDIYVDGPGWVVNDEPDEVIERLAAAVQLTIYGGA